jgi:Subtilase family
MPFPDLPPGHVRVLVERPNDRTAGNQLGAAAHALLTGEDPSAAMISYASTNQFLPFIIDTSFGAVPIGAGSGSDDVSLPDLNPDTSHKFLIRALVPADRRNPVPERLAGELVYADPVIGSLRTCSSAKAVGTADVVVGSIEPDVRTKLGAATLQAHGLDGSQVAIAIVDTGIYLDRITQPLGAMSAGVPPAHDPVSSWTPPGIATKPFSNRLGHGTMCAYDALIVAPNATLIDISMLLARAPGVHSAQATASSAIQAYFVLASTWLSWSNQAKPPFRALVVNNSWGIFHPDLDEILPNHPGRFIDNPGHAFRRYLVRPLAAFGVDIIFAGANCGTECCSATCLSKKDRMIMAANAYREVLTVAGCDVNDDRVGYSSKGPGIANLHQEKPDLTAYTHFLGSKVQRCFVPDTGVSAACAVAAGCVAALRSKASPKTLPSNLFDILRNTARAGNGGGPGGQWNPDYGFGIINPVAAAKSLGLIPP